jgi:hypothetical protein
MDVKERDVVIGGLYRHFKGKLYKVLMIAKDSETCKKMVVYQGQYDDNPVWVRDYDDFLMEVNHEKYPDVQQKYRFELID